MIDNDQYDELYWEIRWDDGKPAASRDYFGDVNIPCGDNMHKAKPTEPTSANTSWPYSLDVWECVDGEKSAESLCKVDPLIDWGN